MASSWEVITIPPLESHQTSLLWFHGLGDSAMGWESTMRQLQIQIPHTKIVLPTAPERMLTVSPGCTTTSWFDLMTMDPNGSQDFEGITEAFDQAALLVRSEISQGIDVSRIFLGGFCAGGALALHTALQFEEQLGGLVMLSGWLLQPSSYPATFHAHRIPMLCCHGEDDAMILFHFIQQVVKQLESCGVKIQFESLGIGHNTDEDELRAAGKWLKDQVQAAEALLSEQLSAHAATAPEAESDETTEEFLDMPGAISKAAGESPAATQEAASGLKSKASAAMAQGDYELAIGLYTQALALADPSPLVYANRAAALVKLTPPRVRAAVKDCTAALKLNPDSAKALKTRGKAYAMLSKWEAAVKDLRLGQQIDYDETSAEVAREAEKQYAESLCPTSKKIPTKPATEKKASRASNSTSAPRPGGPTVAPLPAEFMQSLLGDPELMLAMQDPEIAPKLQDIVTAVMNNPMQAMDTVVEYVNDPKLGPLIMKLMGKFETKTKWTSIDEVD